MFWQSRKFLVTLFSLLLVTFGGIFSISYVTFAGLYPTFIGGVLGVLSLYFTGNVVNKHVVGKALANIPNSSNKTISIDKHSVSLTNKKEEKTEEESPNQGE